MIRFYMLLLYVSATISAADIVLSKDSLGVYNDLRADAGRDSLTIFNNGSTQVHLDSARIVIDDWSTNASWRSLNKAQGMISALYHGSRTLYYFSLDSIGAAEYRCIFQASSSILFPIGPSGDSTLLGNFEIGWNFFGDVPVYPEFIKGIIRCYFGNGEVVTVRICSHDLRPTTVKLHPTVRQSAVVQTAITACLINGQRVADKTRAKNQHRVWHRVYSIKNSK